MNPIEECEAIINALIREGFKYQVSRQDLEKEIMWRRGIDERTINRWIKALVTFEYIIQNGHNIYHLNPIKIPKLAQLLKENPQTKMM